MSLAGTVFRPSERRGAVVVSSPRITIVGAGMAGLTAAYELERLGYRVEILEGSHRLGGRVYTHQFADGATAELGAMRIPRSHRMVLGLIGDLGLGSKVCRFESLFSDPSAYHATATGYARVGDVAKTLVTKFRRDLPQARSCDEALLLCGWLAAAGEAIAPAGFRTQMYHEFRHGLLPAVGRLDLRPFVGAGGCGQIDVHAFFAAHPEIKQGCGGRIAGFIDDILAVTSAELIRLEGGLGQLPTRLSERIRGPIKRGHEVIGLDVRDDCVLLDVQIGDVVVRRRCEQVLCTIPFSVLRRLRIRGLSEAKMKAISDMPYWPATKVAFHCREAFWERDGITGGASFSGGRIRQTYYQQVDGRRQAGAVLLASYTLGEEAEFLGRLPVRARHALVRRELGRMHPEVLRPGMLLNAVSVAWGRNRWSRAAAVTQWGTSPAEREAERATAAAPEKRLFFAGEHCSSNPAWIEGAVESGVRAVRDIQRWAPLSGARS
ncbi:flavin monoamine oxidase family protein [Kribbella sp. NBC_00359]|uniref:flavin monoamine oxidase family protein n=1 Tax=Kribbella sp. NBC_00359 TaxID=2975966 RepID=UPI002E1EE335